MTCPTTSNKPAAAAAWAAMSPCEKLAHVEYALMQLASGQTKIEVRYGDYHVEYGVGSVTYLKGEVTRLRRLCDPGAHHAISIGRSHGGCR